MSRYRRVSGISWSVAVSLGSRVSTTTASAVTHAATIAAVMCPDMRPMGQRIGRTARKALAFTSIRVPKPLAPCFATDVTSSEVLQVGVLGPLEAQLGGRPIPLGGAKQRAVLATLLLHACEVVSRETGDRRGLG